MCPNSGSGSAEPPRGTPFLLAHGWPGLACVLPVGQWVYGTGVLVPHLACLLGIYHIWISTI